MATKTASTPPVTPPQIERLAAVKLRTGLSRSTITKLRKNGEFPQPIKLGARAVGWRAADIDTWIASRVSVA